jgi:hypothetical protein
MQTAGRTHINSAHIVALVIGIGGIAFGLFWGITHAGEPIADSGRATAVVR